MLGIKIKYFWFQLGSVHLLNAFFSTVAVRLEKKVWGSRFPVIMTKLTKGKLTYYESQNALEELEIIKKELQELSIEEVIWNINDQTISEPNGFKVDENTTNLSNYFKTINNEDLLSILYEAFSDSISLKEDLIIHQD